MREEEEELLRAKVLATQSIMRAMLLVLRGTSATTSMVPQMKEVALRSIAGIQGPVAAAAIPGGNDLVEAVYAEVEKLFAPPLT